MKSGNFFILSLLSLILVNHIEAQFLDNFTGTNLQLDEGAINGWTFYSGDGTISMDFKQSEGVASLTVDAMQDKQNIWWAVIRRVPSALDIEKLLKPEYELRIETRIKVSHAPRRVNLQAHHSRTVNYRAQLMEYDIPDTTNWHTISLTTKNFDVLAGDIVYVQLALMDWGLEKYQIDLDYYKVDVVHIDSAGHDLGSQMPYHPDIPETVTFQYHIPVVQDCMVDPLFPEINFNDWKEKSEKDETSLLSVNNSQIIILRWDLSAYKELGISGAGLLELTTFSVQKKSEEIKDFGLVRVFEILDGEPVWNQQEVTFDNFAKKNPMNRVINTQTIIDIELSAIRGEKNFFTISGPVLQRMIDGKTQGLALQALGAVNASFYSSENLNNEFSPKLHLNMDSKPVK